jgi:hypothetical protein
MNDTTYNGWTNYATWRVYLEMFDGMAAKDVSGRYVNSPSELKELCKEMAEQLIEESSSEGLARDYALSFLSDVNWWEIADHLISEDEEESEET